MIINIILVGVLVPNNLQIIELHRLPVNAPFSLTANSLQGAIFCRQHHGVIRILHSINMEVLIINYSRNGIIIAYLLSIKVLLCRLSVNIIWSVPLFLSPPPQNIQPFSIQ